MVFIGAFPQFPTGTHFTGISRLLQIKHELVGAYVYHLCEYAERLFLSLPQIFWLVEWKGHATRISSHMYLDLRHSLHQQCMAIHHISPDDGVGGL
jgi:hypothetical protein